MNFSHLIEERDITSRLLEEIAFLTLKVTEKDLIIEKLVEQMVEDATLTREDVEDMVYREKDGGGESNGEETKAKTHKGV